MRTPEQRRARMVEEQLAARDISDARVLSAMARVPRHSFVSRDCAEQAYDDRPLPIGQGQTISQPYMVAYMTQLLAPGPNDFVLEIGTGSGYQTAVLSLLAGEIVTMERHGALQERAQACLAQLGCPNIRYVVGDGTLGYPPLAPYSAILVTAGSPQVPPALLDQLEEGGRLVCPVGGKSLQRIEYIRKQGSTHHTTVHTDCVFVPLYGEGGWPDETT